MTFSMRAALCAASALASMPAAAQTSENDPFDARIDPVLTDQILVTSTRHSPEWNDEVQPPQAVVLPADAAAIAAQVPGGALVGNGALSGQLSYRGLAGERVLGRVNGQRFASGGPNAMDPPLHYAPSVLLDRIEISRGVAPVSQGPAMAAAVNAELVQTQFSGDGSTQVQSHLSSQYRTADNSYAVGGLIGIAAGNWRAGIIASREEGGDYEFPGGTAGGTSFERNLYGMHAAHRIGDGEIFVEYRRSETDPTGNPPFALDIVYFDTDFIQGGYTGAVAANVDLDLRIGHVAVRHLMDNQTTRSPEAPPTLARATFADADTTTIEGALRFGSNRSYVQIGGEAELIDKFVTITNPTNADFFIDAQPDLQSDRYGAFVQWRSSAGEIEFEVGARIDETEQTAGIPQLGSAVPMGPRVLSAAYEAADRQRSSTTVDGVSRFWIPMDQITPRITLARKERVPSVLERFGWLPTEASFGLADGNIYVGNLDLKAETAWIAELGFDLDLPAFTLRPTLYYRRIDDFIQGVPFDATIGVIDSPVEMIAAMNGDSTPLQFGNVDAEFYGADLDFVASPVDRLEIAGTASFVRAERRDIDDDLYRIPPANLQLSAVWTEGAFSFGTNLFAAADQNRVSVSNDEEPSDGYVVVGLFGQYRVSDGMSLEAGIENLFDESYQPHLSGRSRVGNSDVALGERLPGYGQGGWVRLKARL